MIGDSPRVRLVTVLLVLSAAGCVGTPAAPTHFAPFSQTDLRVGTGDAAVEQDTLTVHYRGWLFDEGATDGKGPTFDATAPESPLTFVLGSGQVIAGWDQGLVGMRVGGLRRLVIPPSLAYGSTRQGLIPPSATLVFEIELLQVNPEP